MITCVAYGRVSTERQAGEDRSSLTDQRAAIEQLAAKLGRTIGRYFEDGGRSGASAEKRPEFMALVAFCKAHPQKDGIVLVLNDSRFGRFPEPDEAAYWRTVLAKTGWRVRYAENDDTTDKSVRHLMRAIGDAGSTAYLDALKANVRRGVKGTATLGFWRTRSPFGYSRQVVGSGEILRDGQKKRPEERVKLVPNEFATLVRQAFERYVSGRDSLASLSRWLEQVAPGEREWHYPAQIRWVLGSRTYVGDIITGDIENHDAHEPLVSRELFAKAQARLADNRDHPRRISSDYVLSGVLTCTLCGNAFIGGGWRGGGKERRPYYVDSGPRHDPKLCPGKVAYLNKQRVESVIIDLVGETLADPKAQAAMARAFDSYVKALKSGGKDGRTTLQKQIAALETERSRLVTLTTKGVILEDEGAKRLQEIRSELSGLITKRDVIPVSSRVGEQQKHRMLEQASHFARVAPSLNASDRKSVV